MYKAGAFDYKISFLCVLSFIFVSMVDNSRKIKGLDLALTAVTTNREVTAKELRTMVSFWVSPVHHGF